MLEIKANNGTFYIDDILPIRIVGILKHNNEAQLILCLSDDKVISLYFDDYKKALEIKNLIKEERAKEIGLRTSLMLGSPINQKRI